MIIRTSLINIISKFIASIFLLGISVILINSSLDIYNNFAYEKAIIKQTPYGSTPLLQNPKDYTSADGFIKSGDFVYVVDWLSDYNGRIIFAKVKTKLKEGYINKDLLVKTNINLIPIFAILTVLIIIIYSTKKLIIKQN